MKHDAQKGELKMQASRGLIVQLKLILMITSLATWGAIGLAFAGAIGFAFASEAVADFVTNRNAFWQVSGIIGFAFGTFLAIRFRGSSKWYFVSCVLFALLVEGLLYAAFLMTFVGEELGMSYYVLAILLLFLAGVVTAAVILGVVVAYAIGLVRNQSTVIGQKR